MFLITNEWALFSVTYPIPAIPDPEPERHLPDCLCQACWDEEYDGEEEDEAS